MRAKKESLLNSDEDLEFLQSLKNDFFAEALDSFERAESSLLNFESTNSELSLLDYKRILHSVKGSAKAVEESTFAIMIHKIEDKVQDEKNNLFFEVQFKFIDLSKAYIEASKHGDLPLANELLLKIEKIFSN